jgi:hypothetical protein
VVGAAAFVALHRFKVNLIAVIAASGASGLVVSAFWLGSVS